MSKMKNRQRPDGNPSSDGKQAPILTTTLYTKAKVTTLKRRGKRFVIHKPIKPPDSTQSDKEDKE